MSYNDLLKIDPTLARQLKRATTPPGYDYWQAGEVYRRRYVAVGKGRAK